MIVYVYVYWYTTKQISQWTEKRFKQKYIIGVKITGKTYITYSNI